MKKLLLMLVALVATVTISAKEGEEMEGWQKRFTPVSDSKELAGIHTAVAGDGSVYASSTYNQDFQFAEKTVAADPDGQTYSCIVKYDKDGNEKWAVTLAGSCTIHAMTADADGTLFIAGTVMGDKVTITDTENHQKEIVNPTAIDPWFGDEVIAANAGFVARFTKEGIMTALCTFNPQTNENVAAIDADQGLAYLALDPISFRPYKLMLDGNRLYVAARYMGDVPELGWKGAYVGNMEWSSTLDVYSYGIFSMMKDDFADRGSVANVQQTGVITDTEYDVDALDFIVYNEVPHVAFVGFGKLTLSNSAGVSKDFEFEMLGNSNNEHAMVLANVRDLNHYVEFHATPNDNLAAVYDLVDATIAGSNCILAGTFYGNFPLDNSVTKEANTSFVASIKMSDCSVNWAKANEVESEAKCMVVTGEEIKASTDAATYTFKTETGDLDAGQTMEQSFEDADCYNDQYVSTVFIQETSVVVFSPKLKPSGINEAQAQKNGAMKYYNVNGVELSAPQKGLNIIKTAEGTRKVVK